MGYKHVLNFGLATVKFHNLYHAIVHASLCRPIAVLECSILEQADELNMDSRASM